MSFIKAKEELRLKINCAKDFFRVQLQGVLKTNPRKFWSSALPRDTTATTMVINNDSTNDSFHISNAFNEYFQPVFTRDNNVIQTDTIARSDVSMNDIYITEEGVLNLILKLDIKKSAGPDGIPNLFLVRYSLWTCRYVTVIFRKSLASSTSWKMAQVLPLFKTSDKHVLSNYRPISITSRSCKMLEHIIYKHIMECLESHKN